MNFVHKCLAVLALAGATIAAYAGAVPVGTQAAIAVSSQSSAKKSPNYARVEEGLYVGGRVAKPPEGTEAVLCLCESDDPYRNDVEVWRWRAIKDGGPAPSVEWLREQVAFVAEQRKAGRQVYVHCAAGISRGPMVTVAYLMSEHQWSRDKALAFVRKHRSQAGPNHYFMALLLEWEKALKADAAKAAGGGGGAKGRAAGAAESMQVVWRMR